MRWQRLFADLEARLEADERAAMEGEVMDLVRAERGRLGIRDRLRAHVGEPLTWSLAGEEPALAGRLLDVGADWVLIAPANGELLVPLAAVHSIVGLSRLTAADEGEVPRRLGIGVILRGLSRDRAVVRIRLCGDQRVTGTIDRVGADHFDVAVHADDEPRREGAVREVRCLLLPAIVGIAVR